MHNMRETLNGQKSVHRITLRCTYSIDIIPCKVDQHDMFGTIFGAVSQDLGVGFVFLVGFASLNRAGNGMGYHLTLVIGFHQEFW